MHVEERKQLPICAARKKLLRQIQGLNSAIIIGETGSGKTTQIPQVMKQVIDHSSSEHH